MGKHKKPRPRVAAGPSPDNNVAESSCVSAKLKEPSQSFGSQVEALAQLLLDANAPAVGVDVAGRVTVWNKRLADITGFNAERVLGRPISDFVYGAQRKSEVAAVVAACIQDKRPMLELRVPLLTTTGRNAEVLTNMTPLLAEDGMCVGVYGVGQDVTEWAIQEKQYATVMMQANAPIIELDKEGNITVWNPKTASMTGYSSVDMVGQPLLPVVDRSFRKIVSEKIDQALTGIPGADFELPLVTARGSRVEIVLCLTPRFDTLGAVMGVVAIGQDVTERNTKEMEYRKLIETANAPIFGVDTEGRVVIFNTKASQISEYSPEEVMGVDLVDTLISEEFRPAVAAVFQSAFQGIETANFEFPLVTKTGRKVEILLNATPRYDHTGQLVGVVGIGQDITDRIIQEKEYSRLIDTANAPIFGVDCNYEVIIWNKKAAAITDYTNEDTIGQTIFKFISEDYRDAVCKVLSKAMEGEGTANFDFPLITKSGHQLDILLNATPKYDHFGNICGAVGIGQDITDRRAQEQEYTRLIDTANAPIFGVDEKGCVNIWNRKAADTTQYSSEEVLGVNLVKNFIPDDFQEAVWTVFSQALSGLDTANFEFPLLTKDGRRLEILLNATPRYNEKGVVIGVVGIGQDITVRMAQEKETNRLIHSASAPIFGVDQDGRVNIWNLKVAEITQFSSEEVMGKDLVNRFVADDHRESVGLLLQKALQGEQSGNFDFPLITKTGRRVEILLNATPRYDELGQIFGVTGIGQDITERIAQEQEYIRLIDTANAPIFGVDSEGRVNIWNKKAAEIMQYTTDAVMGEKLVEKYITKDYQDAVSNVLSEALKGVDTANFEFPLITKAGRRVEILLNATPRYNEHGAVIGMVGIGQDITDRIAQEQEYMRLIDTANAPIFGVDINGRVNIWNRKAAETTQYTNAEVLGKDLVAEFISEEYKIPVRSVLEKAFEGVETANFEFPLITRAGRRVEILLNATPRYNEQGEVMGMVGIGQDITVRMAQEKEKNRMIHSANAPIFGADQDGLVNIWNLKVAEITQFSSEEVMGQDLVNCFVAEDHRDEVRHNLRKALEGKPTGNFDFPLITKTGRRVEILLNATPRYDELGQIFGVTGIGQDITERIAQEQEYIRLIDTANAPIFGVDSEGRVNIWNKKAAEIMQYTTDAVMGEKLVEKYITKDYQDAVSNVLSEALKGVDTANFEFPLITKAGRRVEILLNATPRYNEHGAVIGMVGIGQDITDRIAQEQEYMRLIDTANAPIFGVDINGRVNIWNRKAAETTQYTNAEVLGKDLVAEFISEEYKIPVRSVLEKAFEGVETANFEFPLITRAGRRVEILLNATPRYNEQGEVMGMVGIGQDITVRMAQEKEKNRMIHSANAPIFGADQDGLVNIWNLKVAEITQFSSEEVMGQDLVNCFVAEDHRDEVRHNLRKALEGKPTGNFDFPLITKTGRRVEILLNATPRYDELGQIFGVTGIGQDITERIAQEQEYIRLIDTANAPIFGVDSEGRVNIWNKKAAEIMQYTTDAVMGEKLVEKYITKDYQDAVSNVLSEALKGVDTANFEFPLITKAGRRVEILLNATPRYNEHGAVIGMVGIGQDITDRIAQEQEYMRLIDTANAPIFGVDINGRVNIWNRKAAETTQYTNAEVLGKDLVAEFISEEYKIPVRSVLEKAFEGVETANFEFPLITRAGRRVEILLNATPRYNEQGEVMGMVGIGQDITVRMAQEKEKNRMIHSANAPIFGADQDGLVNIWNLKVAEITQFSSEEVMGQDLVNCFVAEDHRDEVRHNLRKALEGKPTGNFDFPLITKTGRRVEILLNATPRYDELGQIFGVTGIGQDITERIAQEQEYIRLIDTANAPIFGVDSEGRVNIWNKKAAEIMQYTTDAVMGEKLVEKYITKDYQDAVSNVLSEALKGVETANFEFPLITKAGRRVEILLNATPRYNEHGAVIGMVGIGQDITDRIAQEQEYMRLIDTANAPIFGVDINGRVNIWNRKAAETTQYTNAEVLGKDLVAEFISEEYKIPVRSVLEKAFEGVETANFEFPLITRAGRRVEILLNATPRYNERGEVMGMVGIGQDITERIAQEQEHSRMIDTANAPIFGVDTDGRVNIWNRKAADIMQYTNEDVLGKNLVEQFIIEEYRVPVRSVLEKAFKGIETANFEFPLITRAGRRVEILLNATPRYNERGEVMGMVGIGQDITERIAQEQEYSRLIDTANAPIFGVDINGRVNIWNRKAADIMQYTNEDVLDKDLVAEFISEEYKVPVRSVLEKAFEGVETANFEFPLITKTGRRVEILLNATPRYNEHGEVKGMVGIGQDITERIAQEQEYTRLIDTANAPIFGVDINGHVNIWNRKAADIMQYTNEDVLGKDLVAEFISNEYKVPVRSVLEKAFEGVETANFEFPLITKAGRRVEILLNATPRYNERGEVMGMVGIGQDITERIAQEQEYSRLIDTANAPIFGVDINGRVNIWNRKAADIMQYTNEDVLDKDLVAEFISEEYKVPVRSVLEKAFEGVETANFEFPLITKAGRRVEILLNATPRYNEHGEVKGMVGIGQDITERIAQEQEYTRLIDTANAPIFGVDINGHVNIWNRKAADIMQYTNEDVLGKDLVAEFISNEYKVPVRSVLEKAFEGVETANFEFPLITKAGRRVEILLNATPRYNERGEVMGMVGIGQDITERIAQEQEYSRLIDTANAPIFGVDINGRVNIWNRKAADIMQYTNEDVLGKDLVAEFISNEYKVPVRSVLEKAFEGVETANFEFPLITKAGRRVEILLNATPRYNERGEVMGMVGIGQDITERIAQEQEYSRLIDTANAPIFGVDINGRVNIWNRKAADIMQYTNEDVLDKDLVAEFISEEYKVPVRSVLEKAFEGVETANFEFPLITKTGRRVEILLNATPRYNEHGEVKGMVGIGQDITERIAQEQEYTRLIDTANAPIFGVDINGHVNIWNRKAADIMQYTNEDVLGKDLVAEFISNEYKVPVRSVLEKAFEGVETANFEFPLITKAGRRVEILLNATPRYNERGEVMGMVGIGQDITERIAQEQEYSRLIDTANAPIFGVDINGRVNIWNRKAADIMQYTNEDVLGKDLVAEFISNEYKVPVRSVLEKAFEGVETANFEFPLITKAGRRVEILLNATPRYNERGEVMGMVGIGQDITERIAQEQEYSRLIDTANAPIFGVDINGRVNIWNRKAADIMQYTNEDVLDKDLVAEFISEEYKVPVRSVLEKAFEGVETANFEFPLITKTGRRVEILLNATPRYNEHGEVKGMVGIGQDITERIAQEQEYTRLIDTANAPIFGVDINGHVNIWNRKAADIMQYTNEDVLGKDLVAEFISNEYKVPVRSVLEKAFEGVETANFEFPLITKAGRRVEILLNATPRYNERGEVMGMVGIGQDITERIAQEQEYSRLIDTANAPIFGVDINGRVNIWNRKAADIMQYTNEDVLGKDLVAEFISNEYKVPVRSVLEKAFEGVETANFEFPLITKAGRRVEILLNATPRYNERGEVMGMVGIGQDITERIAQEQEYSRLIDTANAPIFGVDINGRVNIWNRKAADIMQYTNEDVLDKDLVAEFISEEYKVPVRSVLEKAFEGVETANFEFPLITKAGRRVEILLNATPRYNEHGEVKGMVGIGQDITERIAQEQEYTRLIDTANAPIFGVDINGHVNIWNRKAADIMQYTNEDVLGKDLVAEFISNEYKVPVRSVLEKAFEGVETANFEFPLITKAGRRVEILLNATPRYNERGEVMGMVGIGQDITERIAQEQEYSRLIDTANAPIFGVDINGRVNIWNRKAADIMQYTNEDVLGKDLVAEFISNEYKVPVRSVLEKAFEGVETANFEFPLITKAGRRVEILLNATPRYNERGEVMGMVGIGQDITERIAQEQEYSRLIDTANAPIFGVDINGRVNIWNRKAADIMQYTNEDVLDKDLVAEFISEEYKVPVRSVLEKAFEGVETANFEFPLITKAGRRVEILLNATPRYNEHGEVKGMVGIGQDITERIAQEQEYSRLIDTANAPIFGVDTNMRINIFNRKAQQITKFTSEEVVGEMYVETIISQEFKAVTYDIMCKALQGNETASFELALTTKTGRKVNILLNATARFDQHGQIVGVVGIGQDITDRIAQEQEYTRLIDSANAPIFGVDVNGCVNIWNKKAAEITQYTSNDVMGENLVEKFITQDYRDAVRLVLTKACGGTETANFEFPLMTKAGRRVEILLNATPRYNEHGEVKGMVGIGQDITERIAQEQEYTRLIDTANAPIFGVDINGHVNIWNRKAADIMQYTNEDVLGKDLVAEFISNEYKVPVRSVLEKAFEGVETANFEFPLITKAGRRVEILLNATPRYNERGEVMGMVGIGQDITERIAQEQEYSRLIDTANAPIFGVDINGRVNIWNRKAADIMQYTNEDVLDKDLVAEFISEEYKVPVRSVLEKAFEGVETANFEFPLITKAGRRVEILLNATPRYNEHGEVKGMVGIGQDITERIAQEQEYSRLIDTANAPIFGVDANMCVNIWNRKAAQITNYSIGEVMGENLVETFISPEFRPIVAEVLSQALTGVETANFEFPLITRPGTRIEILLNATPRYDSNGSIVGVVGIGQDITDRIAQEHEYFRLIDTANAPIFGIDTNGRINEWNQKIEEITGYHKSSVLGLSLVHTFITPESRQQVRQLLNQALIGIDVGEMELPMTTKRGVFLLLLVNASSKKDMHGNIRGVIGVGQDYTARKHMEAAKVNFLASFSHELRTPLNGVLGMLELLKEQPLDKSIERYVHMAYVSGSLLLNLINDILDLSKIEAGHLEISTAPFQMHDLLDYSIEIFKFKAGERGLKLELKCGDNVPKAVIGDVVRLRQVLLNLLSNAIKFTNEGSITVACSVVHSPELPRQFKKLLFQVIDTGIGMDAEEKMRLFSLFTKLERTRQNNPTGSGLGLAICKQLAELMDGQIDVDSELGVGSNFFFTVVVRLIDEIDPKHAYYSSEDFLDPSTALLSPERAVRAGEKGENTSVRVEVPTQARILVVEDNEFNWEVVKCFLQQDDHLLQWEVNGRDAVKAYSENHMEFDLIFMDCEMPIMDGYTATATIRQFEQKHSLPRIPILGLTAYAMSGDRQKCLDCGMDEFMVKPISKLSLRKAIRQWMRIRYLGQQSTALGVATQIPGFTSAAGQKPVTLRNGPRPAASPMRIPAPSPGAPTPMPSFESDLEDVTLMDPVSTARLAPASRHMQQLDLAQAISNLELDDPMSIGLQSGRAVRTATPTTSIFSLGPSVNNHISRQTSSNDMPDLLRLSRNTSGASTSSPPDTEKQTSETSATLPYIKAPFGGATTSPAQTGARSPLTANPTLWSHPPFNKKDMPSGRPQSWPGIAPKKVSFHENIDYESTYPSRGGHSSNSGSGMPSVLERMETGSSVEDDMPSETTTNTESAVSHSIDPMSIEIPEGDPVNYTLGVDQCGGHEELFLTLLEKFATTSEAITSRVVEAHKHNDFVTARREAHSLKGSSAYVAALRVSKCAFRVQVAYEHLMAQQANGEGSDTLAAKQIVDDSVRLLTKEQRLLRGYLRRNFEFKSQSGPSQVSSNQQLDNQDKPTGPCCVM